MRIGILDYNAGNVQSVASALKYIGVESTVVSLPSQLSDITGLIIPGVGSFKEAAFNLKQSGFTKSIIEDFAKTKKVLGICLGMQIMYDYGTEEGISSGLGIFSGKVDLLDKSVMTPHMGWNEINVKRQSKLTRGLDNSFDGYFAHSYRVYDSREEVSGICNYTADMPVMISKGNIYGVQFHPEKSGNNGLRLLKNFKEMCYEDYTISRH